MEEIAYIAEQWESCAKSSLYRYNKLRATSDLETKLWYLKTKADKLITI